MRYSAGMAATGPIGNPEFTYVQAVNAIAARIQAGEITRRLSAERELARELGVSYQTLRHGIAWLRERGLVVARHGRGSFVTPQPEQPGQFSASR